MCVYACVCLCVNGSATERVSRSRMRCRRSWELCPGPVLLRSSLQQDHKIHMKRTIHMLRLLLLGNVLQGEFLPVALGGPCELITHSIYFLYSNSGATLSGTTSLLESSGKRTRTYATAQCADQEQLCRRAVALYVASTAADSVPAVPQFLWTARRGGGRFLQCGSQ